MLIILTAYETETDIIIPVRLISAIIAKPNNKHDFSPQGSIVHTTDGKHYHVSESTREIISRWKEGG